MAESKKPFKGYNKEKHSRTGGLNDKYRKKINREEGSNLKRPVTGKVEPGSKAAKRRKSFCARMSGVKGPTSKDGELTPKGAALKRWKCHKSLQKSDMAPKQKLASFLREHIDNKLALKAAEPTITKSNESYSESLEKGARGDWEKEGYVISHKESPHGGIYVQAHDKNGKLAGFASIGYHDWDNSEDSEGVPIFSKTPTDHIMSYETEVNPKHQRKGLASAMYRYAEDYYGVPIEMGSASPDAEKLWNRPFRPFGKSELKKDLLPGGKGDTKDISDFDAKEVEMGMKVELEHTKDINVAKEIVADHLSEDPAYYSKLKGSGLADELNKAGRCWDGYEPTPGKKPYSKGSCRKIKKSELNKSDVSLHLINQFEGSPTSPTEHHYAVKHKGQEVGRAIVFDKDPKSIHNAGKIGPSLKDIRLKPEHQGKGLSEQVINKLVETHGPLASDSRGNISEAGAKMFAKYGTKQLDNSYVLSGSKMQKTFHQKLIKALACKCKEKELKKSISAMAIESGEYKNEPLDSHHHNRIGQEYRGMAKQAHMEGNRNKAREYHEKALKHFKKADEMGFQAEEPLEKKISSKLVGAGLTAMSSLYSPSLSDKASQVPTPQITAPIDVKKVPDIDSYKAYQAISNIESSGGKNIIHKFLSKQGQRAVSQYGLLPTRVIELYARSPEFRNSTQGQMVGKIVEDHMSKYKTKNFYDTAAFLKNTPMAVKQKLFNQINEITKQKEHDDAIFYADRKHSLKNLSSVTNDPVELNIMATHSHHWHWPRTKKLYEKGGIEAVINDEKSKEGNYIKKYNKHLPEDSPIKQKIEQFLNIPKKLFQLKNKKEPFHGS